MRARNLPLVNADAHFLKDLGPSWAAMTAWKRDAYGSSYEASAHTFLLSDVAELLKVALEFPRATRAEGLATVVRRWSGDEVVIALAERLDGSATPSESTWPSDASATRIATRVARRVERSPIVVADVADRNEVLQRRTCHATLAALPLHPPRPLRIQW